MLSWDDESLSSHFRGAQAVVSCLGNRQPGISQPELKKGWVAHEGSQAIIRAMQEHKIDRVVAMSSVGVEEDFPPMEFIWIAKVILGLLFLTPGLARKAYWDLAMMERIYRNTPLDYLFVRPVGLGEEVLPTGHCPPTEKARGRRRWEHEQTRLRSFHGTRSPTADATQISGSHWKYCS